MELNKEDCKYFYWTEYTNSCCGRPIINKKYGNCDSELGKGRMCNTTMHYCNYEKKEDESTKEL